LLFLLLPSITSVMHYLRCSINPVLVLTDLETATTLTAKITYFEMLVCL